MRSTLSLNCCQIPLGDNNSSCLVNTITEAYTPVLDGVVNPQQRQQLSLSELITIFARSHNNILTGVMVSFDTHEHAHMHTPIQVLYAQ